MRLALRLFPTLILAVALPFAPAVSQVLPEELVPASGLTLDGVELVEDACQVLSTNEGERPEIRDVPGMHVLDKNRENPLRLYSTDEVTINAVICWRSAARFSSNDYLVAETLEVPLYIKTDFEEEDANRTMALEKVAGGFRVRLLSGPDLTESEREDLVQVVRHFNEQISGKD